MNTNTARNRTIDYEPLNAKFTDKACSVGSIDFPQLQRTRIVKVFLNKDKTPQFFHTKEEKQIVNFTIEYVPLDTDEGKTLLPHVKELVEAVLKADYEPKVATVNLLKKDGQTIDETKVVNDCVITEGEILVDEGDYFRIKFYLQGLLAEKAS